MDGYDIIIDEWTEELVEEYADYGKEATKVVAEVAAETAEKFRDEYERIVYVDEDEYDEAELRDLFKELDNELDAVLKCYDL